MKYLKTSAFLIFAAVIGISAYAYLRPSFQPNGKEILRMEKLRAAANPSAALKSETFSGFVSDAAKTCGGNMCVLLDQKVELSWGTATQSVCSSMGSDAYSKGLPEGFSGGKIPSEISPECDRIAAVTVDQKTKNAWTSERNGQWYRYEETSKIPGGYVTFTKTSWCGGVKWSQKILSDSGSEITELPKTESVLPYPATLKVGNKEFAAQPLFAEDQPEYLGTVLKTVEFPDVLSVSEDASAAFEKFIRSRSFLAESYLVRFREYPGLRVKYQTKTTPSERIVFLGEDPKRVSKIVQPVTDSLLDAKLSERILREYDPEKSSRVVIPLGTSKDKALGPSAAYDTALRMPPFRVDEFDDKGYYLLYSNADYEFSTFGDACSVGLDNGTRTPIR